MEWLIGKAGLDGHVRRNRLRVVLLFFGFQLAAQVAILPVGAVATLFFDYQHLVLINPEGFLLRYSPGIAAGSTLIFLFRWWRFPVAVGARLAAHGGTPACLRLQRLVRQLAVLNGMAEPKVVMIDSGASNAFAAGMSARDATIIVTTGLEAALTDDELNAVLAHEMAHLVFGDTRVMAAAAVTVETLDMIRGAIPWRDGLGWKTGLLFIFMPLLVLVAKLLTASSALADTVVRGTRLVVSSSREMIADAEAIRMTRNPAALISALHKIDGRSGIGTFPRAIEAMMIDGLAVGPEATHPTIGERVATIARLTGEHFPLPFGFAAAGRLPDHSPAFRSTPCRPAFGKPREPAEPGLLAQMAFARVRVGQGRIIKATPAFRILAFAPLLLVLLGFAVSTLALRRLEERDAATKPSAGTHAPVPVVRDEPNGWYGTFSVMSSARDKQPPPAMKPEAGRGSPAGDPKPALRGSLAEAP